MMGLIWYVQLVHYPGFRFIHPERFDEFHQFHSRFTGIIVAPVMLTELGTSFYLFLNDTALGYQAIGFYIVVLIWISTAFLSVPSHKILSGNKNDSEIDKLINTNWIRTGLWTAKAFLGLYLVI
ncbi:hypothetical protein [Balneola sp. MJW-20]|uniref:hypothetical protein n=1 Tax=Gracilimonas aurantiaca TaxID=3234185 RepID=UPI00390CD7CA